MSERGVFAVDRGIWEHECFADEPFTEREAWMWLCGAAAWKEKTARVGKFVVSLKRGQCAFSLRFLAEKWKWSKSKVDRFLADKSNRDMIETETGTGVTVITINNYDVYQKTSLPSRDTSETQIGTEAGQKRDKEENIKNIERTTSLRSVGERGKTLPSDWTPSEVDLAFATEMLGRERASAEIPKFRDYWDARAGPGAVKRNWSATWRNWIRKAQEDGKARRNAGNSGGSLIEAIDEMRSRLAGGQDQDFVQQLPARSVSGAEVIPGPGWDGDGTVRRGGGGPRNEPTDWAPAQMQVSALYRGSG